MNAPKTAPDASRRAPLLLAVLLAACSGGAGSTTGSTSTGTGGNPCAGKSVDDGNPCTHDGCDAAGTVTHNHVPMCTAWRPLPSAGAPEARESHTAVWTGSKMIVWGGSVTGKPPVTATGGVYDPAAKTWKPTSTTGAPPPRFGHVAVWTGTKMLVWGGYGKAGYEATGGAYDPATDTWTALATTGAPDARGHTTAVWTGTEMIVWGGTNGPALSSGARYDPATSTWAATSGAGAPKARQDHTAVWTGSAMIVWSGTDSFDWLHDGAIYSPAGDQWTTPTALAGAPLARQSSTALWTGKTMVIWGGWSGGPFLDTGGILDPSGTMGGTWTPMTTAGPPSPRQLHTAVWTGSQMMVWGGCGDDTCKTVHADGGLWTPDAAGATAGGTWETVPASAALAARKNHTAVWTGSEVIVWGGSSGQGLLDSGAEGPP